MEEMMDRQGQGQSQGGKELEISLEQQQGSSAQDSNQQCALAGPAPCLPALLSALLLRQVCGMRIPMEDSPSGL